MRPRKESHGGQPVNLKMNSQDICDLIDSEFEDYPDDSDDDPTWKSSHNVNSYSKCLYIIIHHNPFFFFTIHILILYYIM